MPHSSLPPSSPSPMGADNDTSDVEVPANDRPKSMEPAESEVPVNNRPKSMEPAELGSCQR